jgi:SAM-dependent methyltransferase
MPGLDTSLHTDMLDEFKRQNSLPRRLYRSVRRELNGNNIYGMAWGDPDTEAPLRFVRSHWVLPYVASDQKAVEIGPGGGRWTRYLLGFGQLFAVDYYPELLEQLKKNFDKPNVVFVQNSGTDFPGVPVHGIDFVFSFGTFVHLEPPLIEAYLNNIREILKPGGNVVIHYSDKEKIMARKNPTFVETTPQTMRAMVTEAGFTIVEEDLTTLWHSSLIRLTA